MHKTFFKNSDSNRGSGLYSISRTMIYDDHCNKTRNFNFSLSVLNSGFSPSTVSLPLPCLKSQLHFYVGGQVPAYQAPIMHATEFPESRSSACYAISGHWGCLSHKLVGRVATSLQVCLSNLPSCHWYSSNWNVSGGNSTIQQIPETNTVVDGSSAVLPSTEVLHSAPEHADNFASDASVSGKTT